MNRSDLPPGVSATDKVVLFDGECVLCTGGARLLLHADERGVFKLGTVQSPEGQAILAWHGLPPVAPDTFVLSEGPVLYTRSDAYVRIVSQLPYPWRLGACIRILPRRLRDWVYDKIARNRFRLFGRRDECIVLGPQERTRLLSAGPLAPGRRASRP
jgi:predicted DCC family thiol-disulfide oxidoreductase YuxK